MREDNRTYFIDGHTQSIDITRNRRLKESIIGGQEFRCGPIDGRPCQGERVEDDRVQAEVPEKSPRRLVSTYQNIRLQRSSIRRYD